MKKQLLTKSAIGLFVLLITIVSNALASPVNLTSGFWNVIGRDSEIWNNSKLYFESQTINGDTYDLTGYFWWENNTSTKYGKEVFVGTLFSDLTFSLEGHLVGHTVGIDPYNYRRISERRW